MLKQKLLSMFLCMVVAIGLVISGCQSEGGQDQEGGNSKGLVISEVMARNSTVVADEDGDYSDWIEIYNGTGGAINLKGYSLTDDENNPGKWFFPECKIGAGEYIYVFASGKNKTETETGIFHTSFSIKEGEKVVLCDAGGKALSTVTVKESRDDMSYGLLANSKNNKYVYFTVATPGESNKGSWSETPDVASNSDVTLFINEYMSNNNYILYDEDGDATDWVEIYNPDDKDVSLKDFCLTDDPLELTKWRFPDVTIKSKEYLVLYLSGKDREYSAGSPVHVGFKIGDTDKKIVLSDRTGRQIDSINVQMLPENISQGRGADGRILFFPRPTPGRENSTEGFEELIKATALLNKGLWINEVASVSVPEMLDGKGSDDWIEIYNGTDQTINLEGYGLTDDIAEPFLFKFPDITLKPDNYLVIYASGSYYYNKKNGMLTAPFKISMIGETIYLTEPDGFTVDAFVTGRQRRGVSAGRIGKEIDKRYFFDNPTPGKENGTEGLNGYAGVPHFSKDGGYAEAGTQLIITSNQNNGVIRYTTDGSDPTSDSTVYESPITISKNVTVRARVFAPGMLPSEDVTRTFIVDASHNIAVVCLSTDPDNLFDHNKGILANGPGWTEKFPHVGANFWKEWERPVHFEYYTESGDLGVDFNAGIKLFGQYSRAEAQKSFSINLKEAYGTKQVCYPFFRDTDITIFENLLLRTSGQDWGLTKLKDAFCAQVIKGQIDLEFMDYRPVAVYINGEYWGLYNLREKVNESYLASHQGLDPDNVDVIKGNNNVRAGSMDAYKELLNYVKTHDLRVKENYDYVSSLVDIDNFIDYWIVETFFSNTDTGNIKFYRERKEGAKWRWILFDMDWALFRSTYDWNMIEEFINPVGHGVGNNFDTTLAYNLMKNTEFQDRFIKRYAGYLNSTFKPDRTISILEKMAAEIKSEIPRHIERWGKPSSVTKWEENINSLKDMLKEKPDLTINDIKETFKLSPDQMKAYFG